MIVLLMLLVMSLLFFSFVYDVGVVVSISNVIDMVVVVGGVVVDVVVVAVIM